MVSPYVFVNVPREQFTQPAPVVNPVDVAYLPGAHDEQALYPSTITSAYPIATLHMQNAKS
jgi:hypothetical protein